MATTFVKNGNNVLVYEGDNDPFSVPGSAYVGPHPSEQDAIVISEKFDPQNRESGLKIYVGDVTTPEATDRKDLIEKLSTDFFFRVTTTVDFGTFRFIVSGEALNVEKKIEGEWVLINAFE